jgi:hypothetical protein
MEMTPHIAALHPPLSLISRAARFIEIGVTRTTPERKQGITSRFDIRAGWALSFEHTEWIGVAILMVVLIVVIGMAARA